MNPNSRESERQTGASVSFSRKSLLLFLNQNKKLAHGEILFKSRISAFLNERFPHCTFYCNPRMHVYSETNRIEPNGTQSQVTAYSLLDLECQCHALLAHFYAGRPHEVVIISQPVCIFPHVPSVSSKGTGKENVCVCCLNATTVYIYIFVQRGLLLSKHSKRQEQR